MTDKFDGIEPLQTNKEEYVFFREEGFYFVHLGENPNIIAHVQNNPGTRRVEDTAGNFLWRLPGPEGEREKP